MLKCSMAWRNRSRRAMLLTKFIEVENLRHAGMENGKLLAPYDQLVAWGLRRETIADAIDENIAHKLIVRTGGGVDLKTGQRLPFRYRLTYFPTLEGPATNEWKKYKGPTQTEKSAERAEKARRAATARWAQKKQKPSAAFGTNSVPLSALGQTQKSSVSAKNLVPRSAPEASAAFGTTV